LLKIFRNGYPFIIISGGLCVSQALAVVVVYLSNKNYHHFLSIVQEAGYLTVPNQHVSSELPLLISAFNGGLFFTLTSGAWISLISYWVGRIDHVFSGRNWGFRILCVVLWIFSMWVTNSNGISLLLTLYLLLLPILIIPMTWRLDSTNQNRTGFQMGVPIISMILFSVICFSQMKMDFFIQVRDNLLLSNTVGKRMNAFYYKNSLFSAHLFKSYEQQLFRTCSINDERNTRQLPHIKRTLQNHDYLPISSHQPVNLQLDIINKQLIFKHHNKIILKCGPDEFLKHPEKYLKQFSEKTDRHRVFRLFTMVSMIFLGATLLVCGAFLPAHSAMSNFMGQDKAIVSAGVFCIILGGGISSI